MEERGFAVPNTVKARQWLALLDNENTHESFKNAPFADQDAIAASFDADEFNDFYQIPHQMSSVSTNSTIYTNGMPLEDLRMSIYLENIGVCILPVMVICSAAFDLPTSLMALTQRCAQSADAGSNKYFTVDFDKTFYAPKPEMTRQGGMCDYYLCPNCDLHICPNV